jgi:hypothetical protein
MWSKTFREAYCHRFGCEPAHFEQSVLRRALHRRSLPIAWLMRVLKPGYFELEVRTLRYLGDAQSSREFRAELDSYRSEYRKQGGFLRNAFAFRLSGRRLIELASEVGDQLRV